jgi:hypothetical protein
MRRIEKFFHRLRPLLRLRSWFDPKPQPETPAQPATNHSARPNGLEPTKGYGPNLATLTKLEKLRMLRRDSIRDGRVLLSWTAACRQAAIDPKTVRQHDPQLRAHWDDPSYQ